MAQPSTTPDPDAIASEALDEIRDATAAALAEIDAASRHDGDTSAAQAAQILAWLDMTAAPDLLGATAVHAPSLAGYLATAREQLDPALAKNKTFKAVAALHDRLPAGPVKAAVERLLIRAYAQGSSVARDLCAKLVTLTRGTPVGELPAKLATAVLVHDAECAAARRDLADLVGALAPPPRALATVRTSPMRRVAGLGYTDEPVFVGRHTHDGTRHEHPASSDRHQHPLAATDPADPEDWGMAPCGHPECGSVCGRAETEDHGMIVLDLGDPTQGGGR